MNMEKMVNYCKNYGFIFQGSEIYGGLSNTFDYGPLGVELKNNLKNAWLKRFIQEDINCVKLDSAILMNPKVWEASGHLKTFSDPLIDCKECNSRYRADKLLEDVEQTSDRIVEFAKALSGGDSEKADEMIAAFKKGFDQATKAWGKSLPDISGRTYDAVMKKFDAWKNGTETAKTETEE